METATAQEIVQEWLGTLRHDPEVDQNTVRGRLDEMMRTLEARPEPETWAVVPHDETFAFEAQGGDIVFHTADALFRVALQRGRGDRGESRIAIVRAPLSIMRTLELLEGWSEESGAEYRHREWAFKTDRDIALRATSDEIVNAAAPQADRVERFARSLAEACGWAI